jgi:mRNA-degrading endonuclease RelE of RelBE toxin-antitoxin system
MLFIESPIFKEDVDDLLTEDEFFKFQLHLTELPEAGDLIEGTGGLRKVRWATGNRGKSGGVRIIYYHLDSAAQIRLLLIYRKGIKDTLSASDKAVLRKINLRW